MDIVNSAGFATALVLSVETEATDSVLIELDPEIENPKISGIEVIEIVDYVPPTDNPTTTPAPAPAFEDILINCGGDEYTEVSGERVWLADQYVVGGASFFDGNRPIDGTQDDFVSSVSWTESWTLSS